MNDEVDNYFFCNCYIVVDVCWYFGYDLDEVCVGLFVMNLVFEVGLLIIDNLFLMEMNEILDIYFSVFG